GLRLRGRGRGQAAARGTRPGERPVERLVHPVPAERRARLQPEQLAAGIRPGEVRFAGKRLFLGMADGALEVGALKPDGKQTMDARSFAAGVQGIKDGGLTWEETHA
ncbi:hypothetical protein AAAX54_14295, partial [Eggerthella lenta]